VPACRLWKDRSRPKIATVDFTLTFYELHCDYESIRKIKKHFLSDKMLGILSLKK